VKNGPAGEPVILKPDTIADLVPGTGNSGVRI